VHRIKVSPAKEANTSPLSGRAARKTSSILIRFRRPRGRAGLIAGQALDAARVLRRGAGSRRGRSRLRLSGARFAARQTWLAGAAVLRLRENPDPSSSVERATAAIIFVRMGYLMGSPPPRITGDGKLSLCVGGGTGRAPQGSSV